MCGRFMYTEVKKDRATMAVIAYSVINGCIKEPSEGRIGGKQGLCVGDSWSDGSW